jgi:hypothetical protein
VETSRYFAIGLAKFPQQECNLAFRLRSGLWRLLTPLLEPLTKE